MANIAGFVWKNILAYFQRSSTKRLLGVLLFFSLTTLIMYSNFNPSQITLGPDEVAGYNIASPVTAVVEDKKQTAELVQQAERRVQNVYREDKYALANSKNDVAGFFNNINNLSSISDERERKTKLANYLASVGKIETVRLQNNEEDLAQYILDRPAQDLEQVRKASLDVVQALMEKQIKDDDLPGFYIQAEQIIDSYQFSQPARDIMKLVVVNSLRPTLIYDREATDRAVEQARASVQPVQKTIKAGEVIVREGERVSPEQISILEQLGILRDKNYPLKVAGSALFVVFTLWLSSMFLRRYYWEIYSDERMMLLLGIIFMLVLITSRLMIMIRIPGQTEAVNSLMGYLAPAAAGSMLVAILLDNRLAYLFAMVAALYIGMLNEGNQISYVIVAFVGATVGVFRVYRLNQMSDLAKSGIHIALANIAVIFIVVLINGQVNLNLFMVGAFIGILNGILSAILMIGALPLLETAFSITSMIRLLELSNPNHELLRKLLLEAPGTYHHSLMVGNLAEASAEAIGANPLLVRVGAYYHDIGKVKRSEYFIENLRSFESPHEKIAPALSALIITSHVRDGVDFAREAKLPQAIIDFIEQHHGTSLAKYFYNRALEEDREGTVSEESFRYEGPKPQSKEVALVMLADTVEAGIRSLKDPTPARIRNMVRLLIKDKFNDGQLESCDLTFKDLETISDSFCKILEGVYHKRIEYPDTIVKEFEKRRGKHGDHDHKPAEQSPVQ